MKRLLSRRQRLSFLPRVYLVTALLCFAGTAIAALPPAPDLTNAAPSVRAAIQDEIRELVGLLQTTEDPVALQQGWISLGDSLFAHEFNSEAAAAYEAAAAFGDPGGLVAYRQGLLAAFDGRIEDAILAFNRAAASSDETLQATARVRRGSAYLEQGDWQSAKVDFAAALALRESSPAALAGAGRAALAGGEAEDAARLLEQALRLDPAATLLYQPLGLAYRELGDRERARASLGRVGEGEPSLEDPVLDAIRLKSRSPQFWLQTGLATADRGDLEGAAQLIGRAASLAPEDLSILANYGRVLAELGNFELALEAFERVVAGPQAVTEDWLYLGRLRQALGDMAGAAEAYGQAAALNPDSLVPREALARIALHEGRGASAATDFEQLADVADTARERARYRYWQAIALLAQGDCAAAAPVVAGALSADEPVASDLLQLAARMRATCDNSLGTSLEETVRWAEQAYEQQPDLMSAETLAMSYAAMGRWTDAEDLQAQAIFEALKLGELSGRPALQVNGQRYRDKLAAEQPFGADDPVFKLP